MIFLLRSAKSSYSSTSKGIGGKNRSIFKQGFFFVKKSVNSDTTSAKKFNYHFPPQNAKLVFP